MGVLSLKWGVVTEHVTGSYHRDKTSHKTVRLPT